MPFEQTFNYVQHSIFMSSQGYWKLELFSKVDFGNTKELSSIYICFNHNNNNIASSKVTQNVQI